LNHNIITGNAASNEGGGIAIISSNNGVVKANLYDNTIQENHANCIGGGIRANSTQDGVISLELRENLIKGNWVLSPEAGGIGLYASGSGKTTATMNNNYILDNKALFGGGILGYAWGSDNAIVTINLNNNIIAGNQAQYGSAIFSCSGKTGPDVSQAGGIVRWELTNNTITANIASVADAIQINSGSTYGDGGSIYLTMKNDILWGNSSAERDEELGVVVEPGKAGIAQADISYSDIGSIGTWGTGTYRVNSNIDKDPLLNGLTNLDFTLSDNSPCIDAGDPDLVYDDGQIPPGKGTKRNDLGAYGGPLNKGWATQ
jgi:hypothetical protein